MQYMQSLGCTMQVSPANHHALLHWLLNLAVARVFANTPAGMLSTLKHTMAHHPISVDAKAPLPTMDVDQSMLPTQRQYPPYHDGMTCTQAT